MTEEVANVGLGPRPSELAILGGSPLPTATAMDGAAIARVTDLIRRAMADAPRLSRRLSPMRSAHADAAGRIS